MFEINASDWKEYEKQLKAFKDRALPYATRDMLNRTAFAAQRAGRAMLDDRMVLRNKHTQRSVRVERAKSLNLSKQEAIVGSDEPYLERQEFGGAVRGKGGSQPIATAYAAGQGAGTKPRTRLPRRANSLSAIRLKKRAPRAANRRQDMVLKVQEAVNSGNRFVYLDLGMKQGIFKVVGGKRNTRRGWPSGAKIQMVWDMSRRSVTTPRNPWLLPATNSAALGMQRRYAEALVYQLRRHKLLGY